MKKLKNSFLCLKKPGKVVISPESINNFTMRIQSGIPTAAGKIGGTEGKALTFMANAIWRSLRIDKQNRMMKNLYELSGVYPQDRTILFRFYHYWSREVFPNIDTLCYWRPRGDWLASKQFDLSPEWLAIDDFYLDNNAKWPLALEGKKVLVVSPFKTSIEKQFSKLKDVWKKRFDVPDFDLVGVIRSPHYAHLEPPKYVDWFEALEGIWSEVEQCEFDVLLIGAGAWGLPLAALAKKHGKIGIHMGGETQMLFGIKAKRWCQDGDRDYMNEHWIYPDTNDTPSGLESAPAYFRKDAVYWEKS